MSDHTRSTSESAVLFLQGPPSIFWRELADEFERQGVATHRVNFSLGDQLYWRKAGAIQYRRTFRQWPAFLEALIRQKKITDILYYADQLPYHRVAAEIGGRLGVRCHAVEHGYLRPDWLTLERDGMGRFSHFPSDPAKIAQIAKTAPPVDLEVRYQHTFGQEAFNEVVYNLFAYFGRPFFPFYKDDKYYSALVDYLPWVVRAFSSPAKLQSEDLADGLSPFFLVALQIQSDYQIRANSRYRHLADMLEEVIASFALHASPDTHLLIKQHPLDNGLERWGKRVRTIAERHGVAERVKFFEQGNLNAILKHSTGVVVVNSTVGVHSLRALKPTIVLGGAIYDVPGLTHQGSLDEFWTSPSPVDQPLVNQLVRAMAATIQVKGNFYDAQGKIAAVSEIVRRVRNGLVNEPGAFVDPPPRLGWEKAKPVGKH
ncbi:capsule biosynthesis protein [Rhizobium halophytocola]|uniref:Capsular polysaccharide export protein n=1 Tax=Rhizobium halophytocola TaxID=735519 RepID=A0ABS4E2Y8_9HYPH|nr:capsular biosynthesis protein [Rhizobium halophytocola]MBP1852292.1 capsular polysaccharide export protein [Rhizobium halophytocola]